MILKLYLQINIVDKLEFQNKYPKAEFTFESKYSLVAFSLMNLYLKLKKRVNFYRVDEKRCLSRKSEKANELNEKSIFVFPHLLQRTSSFLLTIFPIF